MYYSYHATAHRLIAQGNLTGYEFLNSYHDIAPCLMLYFDNHKPMLIRMHKWDEYLPIISNRKESCTT